MAFSLFCKLFRWEYTMASDLSMKMAEKEKARDSKRRSLTGWQRIVSYVLGVSTTLLVFYTAFQGAFLPKIQIGIVMCSLYALCFFWIPGSSKSPLDKVPWYDLLLSAVSLFIMVYTVVNCQRFITRLAYSSPLGIMDKAVGVALILLTLECARRTVGWAIVIVSIIFTIYAFFGTSMPGMFRHPNFTLSKYIDLTYVTTEGIFGSLMTLTCSSIYIFVAFGVFLQHTGGDKRFMDLAFSLAGKSPGGPAKVSVLSSGLMAMLSGNTISNVVTTGSLTIPLMKKSGYTPEQAGAVESVASSGGQITPPVMGSVAFLIADALSVSYLYVCGVSIIPAVVFYCTTWFFVDKAARKAKLPPLPDDMIMPLKKSLIEVVPVFIPIVCLVIMLIMHFSPAISGALCTVLIALCAIPYKDSRFNLRRLINALEACAIGMVSVVGVMATASIVVGILTKTGLMAKCTSIVMTLSGGNIVKVILIIMIIAYIMGMGLPSASCYIILASLCAPVLINMNVAPIVAHMIIFWFCQLAGLTPPVCVTAFVAAGIAGSSPMKTGFTALKFGSSFYFIPLFFLITPLLTASIPTAVLTAMLLISFSYFFTGSLEGFLFTEIGISKRALALIASISFAIAASYLFILPLRILGFAVGCIIAAVLWVTQKKRIQIE